MKKLFRKLITIFIAWIGAVLSYTIFNIALALASGTLSASAGMNFVGGILRSIEILVDKKKRTKPDVQIAIQGAFAVMIIAAPLWLAYQLFGATGTIVTIVYDSMLVIVTAAGDKLGIGPKMEKAVWWFVGGISLMAAMRVLYHRNELHWSILLIFLIASTTAGYILFNKSVKASGGSITTQILMNFVGGIMLEATAIVASLASHLGHLNCLTCSPFSFSFKTLMGIFLGGVAIYFIVKTLAILYHEANMETIAKLRMNLSGFVMPFVYEGLVAFGAPLLSWFFGRPISTFDVVTSLTILILVTGKLGYYIQKHM